MAVSSWFRRDFHLFEKIHTHFSGFLEFIVFRRIIFLMMFLVQKMVL